MPGHINYTQDNDVLSRTCKIFAESYPKKRKCPISIKRILKAKIHKIIFKMYTVRLT